MKFIDSLIRLEFVESGDVTCPHCGQQFDVDWDTECGHALAGDSAGACPNCKEEFTISVWTRTGYSTFE